MDYVNTMRAALEKIEDAIRCFENDFHACVNHINEAQDIIDSTVFAMEDDVNIPFYIYDAHCNFSARLSNRASQLFYNNDDLQEMYDMIQNEADWLEAVLP